MQHKIRNMGENQLSHAAVYTEWWKKSFKRLSYERGGQDVQSFYVSKCVYRTSTVFLLGCVIARGRIYMHLKRQNMHAHIHLKTRIYALKITKYAFLKIKKGKAF